MASAPSWVGQWAVGAAWVALAGNQTEVVEVDQQRTQEEALEVGVLSLLALEVPLGVRILWVGRPLVEGAYWEVVEHAVDLLQGAPEVGGPYQEVLAAWASEALHAWPQGGNVGDPQQPVLLHLEVSPLWASLAALTREEEQVGKQEAIQVCPCWCQEWSGQVLGR